MGASASSARRPAADGSFDALPLVCEELGLDLVWCPARPARTLPRVIAGPAAGPQLSVGRKPALRVPSACTEQLRSRTLERLTAAHSQATRPELGRVALDAVATLQSHPRWRAVSHRRAAAEPAGDGEREALAELKAALVFHKVAVEIETARTLQNVAARLDASRPSRRAFRCAMESIGVHMHDDVTVQEVALLACCWPGGAPDVVEPQTTAAGISRCIEPAPRPRPPESSDAHASNAHGAEYVTPTYKRTLPPNAGRST